MASLDDFIGTVSKAGDKQRPVLDLAGNFCCYRGGTEVGVGDGYFVIVPAGLSPKLQQQKIKEIKVYLDAQKLAAKSTRRKKAEVENEESTGA